MSTVPQLELDFGSAQPAGYDRWVEQRQQLARQIAERLRLPVGHQVEVCLIDGSRFKGKLRLRWELLSPEVVNDRAVFYYREIEKCVRID